MSILGNLFNNEKRTTDKIYPYIDELGRTVYLLNKNIEHQGIGGKEIAIDDYVTSILTNEEVLKEDNWATHNFIKRRPDFNMNFPYKLYYGKVCGLGYVVAEDEFDKGSEKVENR